MVLDILQLLRKGVGLCSACDEEVITIKVPRNKNSLVINVFEDRLNCMKTQ